MARGSGTKLIADNRRARHEYHLLEKVEAGIALTGTEVKSLRAGHATLQRAFGDVRGGELWLVGAHIPEYAQGNMQNHDPDRDRKLLLHRREIEKLIGATEQKGLTLVPLELYFRRGRAKLVFGLGRGKKQHDKRAALKERIVERETARAIAVGRRR